MKEKLIKCKIKTTNSLIVECELTIETIKELKQLYRVTIYNIK